MGFTHCDKPLFAQSFVLLYVYDKLLFQNLYSHANICKNVVNIMLNPKSYLTIKAATSQKRKQRESAAIATAINQYEQFQAAEVTAESLLDENFNSDQVSVPQTEKRRLFEAYPVKFVRFRYSES